MTGEDRTFGPGSGADGSASLLMRPSRARPPLILAGEIGCVRARIVAVDPGLRVTQGFDVDGMTSVRLTALTNSRTGVPPKLELDQLLSQLIERAHEVTARQRWQQASMEITRHLLAAPGDEPLRVITDEALQMSDADVATLVLPTAEPGRLRVAYAAGAGADALADLTFPVEGSVASRAFVSRLPVLLLNACPDDEDSLYLHSAVDVGPVMVVPLIGTERVRGVLGLARLRGEVPFTDADVEMAAAFGNHVAVALELAAARADQQRMEILEDRDRIARELHDQVTQRLFAAGLTLQGVAAAVTDEDQLARLEGVVDDLDQTITAIRTTIFGLRGPLDPTLPGPR